MKIYTREEVVDILSDKDLGIIEDRSLFDIFKYGCVGWDNREDRELIEYFIAYHFLHTGKSLFTFIDSTGKESTIELLGDEEQQVGLKIDGIESDYEYF